MRGGGGGEGHNISLASQMSSGGKRKGRVHLVTLIMSIFQLSNSHRYSGVGDARLDVSGARQYCSIGAERCNGSKYMHP